METFSKLGLLTGRGKQQIVHSGPESSVPASVIMIVTIILTWIPLRHVVTVN